MIYVHSIDYSLTNGLGGPAISIYYSGCDVPVKCEGCHNKELWTKQNERIEYKALYKQVLWYNEFNPKSKLTVAFLGGDPLAEYNRRSFMEVTRKLKRDFSDIEIILYSWRLTDDIDKEWVKNVDYGVLGKFEKEKFRENFLPGSSNQVLYDFKNNKELPAIYLKELKAAI